MSWTEPIPVVHDEPIGRAAVEEVVQMLGHEPRDVAAVFIEAHGVGPAVVRVIERDPGDRRLLVEHRHTIL